MKHISLLTIRGNIEPSLRSRDVWSQWLLFTINHTGASQPHLFCMRIFCPCSRRTWIWNKFNVIFWWGRPVRLYIMFLMGRHLSKSEYFITLYLLFEVIPVNLWIWNRSRCICDRPVTASLSSASSGIYISPRKPWLNSGYQVRGNIYWVMWRLAENMALAPVDKSMFRNNCVWENNKSSLLITIY